MPQRTATTAYGEVEYETVQCESCENEVAKEDALALAVGDIYKKRVWSHSNERKYYFNDDSDFYEGWLCPYCGDVKNTSIDRGRDTSNPANSIVSLLSAVREAHSAYVERMVANLSSGEMGSLKDDNVPDGLVMLLVYLTVVGGVLLLTIPAVATLLA
jgi:hypothetical protein